MMSCAISILMISNIWVITNSNNPMKASFFILTSAMMMFLMVALNTSMIWMPLIFFILFTGGILMMFMILSSVLPNEKTMKIKYSKMLTMLMILILWPMNKNLEMNLISSNLKSFISSGVNLMFMMMVIMMYFFMSININSIEKTSMRSVSC